MFCQPALCIILSICSVAPLIFLFFRCILCHFSKSSTLSIVLSSLSSTQPSSSINFLSLFTTILHYFTSISLNSHRIHTHFLSSIQKAHFSTIVFLFLVFWPRAVTFRSEGPSFPINWYHISSYSGLPLQGTDPIVQLSPRLDFSISYFAKSASIDWLPWLMIISPLTQGIT